MSNNTQVGVRPSPWNRISTSDAYLLLMTSLLLGLPLLTGYYSANPSFFYWALAPYFAATISIAIFLVHSQSRLPKSYPANWNTWQGNSWFTTFNSLPIQFVYAFVAMAALLFLAIDSLVMSSYPSVVPLSVLDLLGAGYVFALSIASVVCFSRIIYRAFPILRNIFAESKYSIIAAAFSISFCIVYLLLVNQIVISGYNTEGTAPSFLGYPSWFAMSPGVKNIFIYLVYLPTLIVQISPAVNLIIIPFEVVFATLLSLLVSTSVVLAHYLISNSGFRCSTRGTALSTGGSILGLTASCPTCLVPTFVSVLFGGVSATVLSFSNLYGVVLPPILSVAILILGAQYLQRLIKSRT